MYYHIIILNLDCFVGNSDRSKNNESRKTYKHNVKYINTISILSAWNIPFVKIGHENVSLI